MTRRTIGTIVLRSEHPAIARALIDSPESQNLHVRSAIIYIARAYTLKRRQGFEIYIRVANNDNENWTSAWVTRPLASEILTALTADQQTCPLRKFKSLIEHNPGATR